MKKLCLVLAMLTLAIIGFGGQTNHLDLRQTAPPASPQEKTGLVAIPLTNSPPRLFRIQKSYSGVLPEMQRRKTRFFKSDPQYRGPDFQHVSINPITGRAEGLVLFSIGF